MSKKQDNQSAPVSVSETEKHEAELQETRYQAYLDERKVLVQGEQGSADQLDKAILSLAAGALGLSLIFLEKIAPEPKRETIGFLYFAWFGFVASLLLILASFLTSQHGYRRQRKILEAEFFPVERVPIDRRNNWALTTTWLNWFSIGLFVLGACALSLFSIQNLRAKFVSRPMQSAVAIGTNATVALPAKSSTNISSK